MRIGEGAGKEGTVEEDGEGGEDQDDGKLFSEIVAKAFDGAGFHNVDVVLGGVQDGGDLLGGEAVDVGHSEDVAVWEMLEALLDGIENLGPYAFEIGRSFGFGVVELGEVSFGDFSGGVVGAEGGGAAVPDYLVEVVAEVFGAFDLVAGFPGEGEGGVDDVVEVGVTVAEDFKGIDVDGAVVFLEDTDVAVGVASFVGLEPGWVFVFGWWVEHGGEGRKFCEMVKIVRVYAETDHRADDDADGPGSFHVAQLLARLVFVDACLQRMAAGRTVLLSLGNTSPADLGYGWRASDADFEEFLFGIQAVGDVQYMRQLADISWLQKTVRLALARRWPIFTKAGACYAIGRGSD